MKVSAIIMASGFSQRMGRNKLTLNYQQQTFMERLFEVLLQLDFHEICLVISPENLLTLQQPLPPTIKVIENSEAGKGQTQSVRLGTAAATGEGFLFLPVDQPLLDATLLCELWPHYDAQHIVFPVHENGQPSSPIFFGQAFRSELLTVSGKGGGRSVRNAHPDAWRPVKVQQPQRLMDIDTPAAYQRLLQNFC